MFNAGKTKMIGLPYGEKNYDMLSRFHLVPERNGQTDGLTDGFAISISRVSMLTRDKNLTLRPLSEAFIRRSWYSVLPVLDTTGRRRVKKAVVCVAQLVAAVITVHGLLSFLSDVYGLSDPSGKMLWLSVDHRRLRRRIPALSRTGRTEYQLLLMKASNRGQNVKF